MLPTLLLLCAGLALTHAAAVPEAEPDQMMEEASVQDDGEVFSGGCPSGWSNYRDRCFLSISTAQTWALAERNCRAQGGNLASVHSYAEESFVKGLIQRTMNGSPRTWIGASDAQQDGIWLWSDSSHFAFTNWCAGEPNGGGREHCIEMNFGSGMCWNDLSCSYHRPYVCVRSR
ncbi:ladderlectin-like [Halichoeres trimaculatus]|uniref:ladderlectin-like n=1 Tax=Halichoeres trimaculatus TaxID=147232 RepID=UPI003D9F45DB